MPCSCGLEVDASCELQLTLRLLAGSVDRAETLGSRTGRIGAIRIRNTIVNIAIRVSEGWVIEEVVRLSTELELHPLRDREVLEDTEVHRGETGTVELVASTISCPQEDRARPHGRRGEGAGEVVNAICNR